jgi:hypothetical protein
MIEKRIRELPVSAARDLLSQCEKKGIEALGGASLGLDAVVVCLLGLCQTVLELNERIQKLEGNQ